MLYLGMKFRIKAVAAKKGMTLEELCQKMDMTYPNYNKQMKGNPKVGLIQKIADALDCSVIELIEPEQGFTHLYDTDNQYHGVGLKPNNTK
ncbi:Predicted transcriptional regulator [Chryseobacterium gleum]|uniref:Predicted transcriptional regulator n=2 Tax=Chryseobacterium gleum TaxID=250 RepID=A0A3S4M3N9_CHRGE|nr:helix-turn-helix transcriptional regulator [Chryseobacterium gleum]EFK36782.1 DNA-binding helix-turn-helix protein [Chryseobacterium gleum ATCC 35910]QQY32038.1 helix-turn-helix transcriptional regulator [Chryseobacterium gleum]VEE10741.1 Predicted transcriptional regulator [Chryseobacterium gleum]